MVAHSNSLVAPTIKCAHAAEDYAGSTTMYIHVHMEEFVRCTIGLWLGRYMYSRLPDSHYTALRFAR